MEKALYWLVKWPWMAAIVVFLAATQVPLAPWYLSVWLMIGVSLMALIIARASKLWLAQDMVLRKEAIRP